jgi:PLP dependent protein
MLAVAYPERMQSQVGQMHSQHGTLRERYEAVRQRIAEAAARSGRREQDIVLIAVTKDAAIDEIRQLVQMGHVDLGESRVQALVQRAAQMDEFLQRHRALSHVGGQVRLPERVRWHMIGHLQRNKVRRIVGLTRLIHSVDSLRLAEEIQTAALRVDEPVEVVVQVNTSGEKSKFGVAPAAARHLVEQIETMVNVRVRGLMCMAPLTGNPCDAAFTFERCRDLFEDIRRVGVGAERFNILSMGMTSDFEVAIECGANVVRIGTAIFGPRTADEAGIPQED